MLNNTKGELRNKVEIKHQGFVGKQVELILDNKDILIMQLLLVNRRLYQVGVQSSNNINGEVQNYFNTFNVNEDNSVDLDDKAVDFGKIEVKIIPNYFKINNQDLRTEQIITKRFNDFSGVLPVTIDGKTITYTLYFIDNRDTEFKSLLLFNIYYQETENRNIRQIGEGVIPISSSEFESSYKTIVNNNHIDFNYIINIRD